MKIAPPVEDPRIWRALIRLTVLAVATVGVVLDAAHEQVRRREARPQVLALVQVLGTADLALSSASRWLRHPTVTEPGAAFADGPAMLDADPAGALIAPPTLVLGGTLGLVSQPTGLRRRP